MRELGEVFWATFARKKPEDIQSEIHSVQSERRCTKSWSQSRSSLLLFRPSYYMCHSSKTDHHTKYYPIFLESKRKMEWGSNQPSPQMTPKDVNHSMQWAPPHQQYTPSYPSLLSEQAYQNSQAQAPTYYQPYHYATTSHPQHPPTPQTTYPLAVPQITYPGPNNTNPQVKIEVNTPPPLPQI
jgi:hypothetical protein